MDAPWVRPRPWSMKSLSDSPQKYDIPTYKSSYTHLHAILRRLVLCLLIATGAIWFTGHFDVQISIHSKQKSLSRLLTYCKPHLPAPLLLIDPPTSSDPTITHLGTVVDRIFKQRAAKEDMDSLVVGVVGVNGLLWSKGYGRLKANDSADTSVPNEHSVYRVASVSKLFATLETFILRDRGHLHWDDPVTRFFPKFTHGAHGWHQRLGGSMSGDDREPITLRQLASHLSGIGRDYPPANMDHWPVTDLPTLQLSEIGALSPGWTYPKKEEILKSIAEYPLVVPHTFPVYSNTGFSLLGWCTAVADQQHSDKEISYADLVKRDIFEPLGMNGSSFLLTKDNHDQVALPQIPDEAGYDMTEAHNPAGGQFSSVSDLAKTAQVLLNPKHPKAVLSPYSVRDWFRPLHIFPDRLTQTGLVWEISQKKDTHGRIQHYYSKSGNLQYYHSELSINRELGFGVVVLMAGRYSDASWFSKKMIDIFQPAFEGFLAHQAVQRYAGIWRDKGENEIIVDVEAGILWITKAMVNGFDLLKMYTGDLPAALWSTERLDEFRIAIGRAALNLNPSMGCLPYWVSFDPFNSRGAPVDLVLFENQDGEVVLRYPSTNITLNRM